MILYRLQDQLAVEHDGAFYTVHAPSIDELITHPDLHAHLQFVIAAGNITHPPQPLAPQAPIGQQEVWAAGVTYYRSRTARMEESKDVGGGSFYDHVYTAERPELFFKSMPHKVAAPNSTVHIRRDATWSVPEPELALVLSPTGKIIGYTIGNDMSSRDIEGQNLLYLPQAKIYDRSCALGPGILITPNPLPPDTRIQLSIERANHPVFTGETTLSEMKRTPQELVEYLFRDQTFPHGCILLTGTGIVPPDSFTLQPEDIIHITIHGIGTLTNHVARL